MALPWFRLYSEFLDDPKVQFMPEHMRYRLVALLCSRCKTPDLNDQVIAFQWRIPVAEVEETKALFIEQGFIDENWAVLKWDKRQFLSDDVTARVQKFRAGETTLKRYMKRSNVVSCNTPDTDTEAEQTNAPMKRYFP